MAYLYFINYELRDDNNELHKSGAMTHIYDEKVTDYDLELLANSSTKSYVDERLRFYITGVNLINDEYDNVNLINDEYDNINIENKNCYVCGVKKKEAMVLRPYSKSLAEYICLECLEFTFKLIKREYDHERQAVEKR